MSSEEDTELRDLVTQTLETNGCLPKLRAQLRASIFLSLDEDLALQKSEPFGNKKLAAHLETPEGQNMFCIVREFLEYFGLDFTISVYEPESYFGRGYKYVGREKLVEDLAIPELKDTSLPLLLQIIHFAQLKSKHASIDINLTTNATQSDSSCKQHIEGDILPFQELNINDLQPDTNYLNGGDTYIEESLDTKSNILNSTFNLSGPSIHIVDKMKPDHSRHESPHSLNSSKAEDTFDGISSASDDKSQSISSETDFSPPIVRDKSHSKLETTYDKLKSSPQKTDKLKTKSSLSSLVDLSPLQLNKTRTDTVLLPSLYNKDFKEKAAIKEFDKLLDMEDNYEEDFMSDSEMHNKSFNSIKNGSDEYNSHSISFSQQTLNSSTNFSNDIILNADLPKKITDNENACRDESESSSVTSEDLHKNFDDILNLTTSN